MLTPLTHYRFLRSASPEIVMFAGPVGDGEAMRALRSVGDDLARFHRHQRHNRLHIRDTMDAGLAALRTTCRKLVLVGGGVNSRYGPGGTNSCK